jgi:hypothetical protein
MDQRDSQSKKVLNEFGRMWLDSPRSLQPPSTYRHSYNAVNTTDLESNFGLSNEQSNELFTSIPGIVRGLVYVEERDQYVVFVDNNGLGQIGIIDEKDRKYICVTNAEIAPELGVCVDQWVDCEVKVVQPCNNLYLYWSSDDVYKRINLDDPCCKFEEIELIKPVCVANIETDLVELGGGLPNGIYQFAARPVDTEGNEANWSRISNSISVSDGDHKPGERSSMAINLKISGLDNRDFHLVDLAVISTIDNVTTVEKFATISSNSGVSEANYLYTGKTGRESSMLISDILTRTNRYIRGKNLIQYDNRLVLYNLRSLHNLDYQRKANEIVAKFDAYIVPLEEAHRFKGLRPNEAYWFAIRWNYSDGTSSNNFIIPGGESDKDLCDDYVDDSVIEQTYYTGSGLQYEKVFSVGNKTDHSPVILGEDESQSVFLDDDDAPEIDKDLYDKVNDLQAYDQKAALDCLCDSLLTNFPLLPEVQAVIPGQLDGAITLKQLQCLCEEREESEGGVIPERQPNGRQEEFFVEDLSDLSQGQVQGLIAAIDEASFGTTDNRSEKDIPAGGARCSQEGYQTCVGNVCYICNNGKWENINNADSYENNSSYIKDGLDNVDSFTFEYEYDSDGCTVIGVKPQKVATGSFGTRVTQNTYPNTEDCNCSKIYGDLAGEKIRLHQVPSLSKIQHALSFSSGVPNKYDQANSEFNDTYMIMIGPSFENIQIPDNLPKPLCPNNPYSITYVERTEANKSVIGSGLGHSCFKGDLSGTPHAIPKHAVNSFERFDRVIEPVGSSTFRGGESIDVGAYTVHSPDFHMRRPALVADTCLFELEVVGKGFRHGIGATGEKPENWAQETVNQKGTRQAVNMNHYISPGEPIVRKVKAMSHAPSDSVVSRGNGFTYPLSNLYRESSTYVELEGGLEEFSQGDAARGMLAKYGGASIEGDNASDRSFTGDIFTDALPLHDNRAHLMTFMRTLPSQYGGAVSQAYIPLGLEAGKGFPTSVGGLVGDSFVGPMTYKRVGMVSDKTNRKISKFVLTGGIVESDLFQYLFGNLLSTIFRVLGLRNGGYIPKNQDPSDHIRVFGGLRYINGQVLSIGGNVDFTGEVSIGDIPPPYPKDLGTDVTPNTDINLGDNYFPQIVKTSIVSYFNSDVNPYVRQLNSVDIGEVYYSEDSYTLKGLNIDSSIPEDSPWEDGWLNRFYSEWRENAKWKLILQGLFTFLFTYMIGIWMMFKGLEFVVNAWQAAGGGSWGLQTIGAILAFGVGIVAIVVGFIWIRFWVSSDADNKIIDEYIGLKNIRPDRRNADGSFSFNEKRIRQFEDNYFVADSTHSQVNKWEVSYGMPDPYITCSCPTEYTNEIIYSNRQSGMSQVDSWRNFKPNNSLEITSEMGSLQKMFLLGNELHAHTTDMLIKLQTGSRRLELDGDSVLLGNGSLFNSAYPIYGGVVEGYGGLSDPNAAEVSAFGYMFPDREARRWFQYTGGMPTPVTDQGVKHFMQENMDLTLLRKFPNFKLVDLKVSGGIGYSHGVDHKLGRVLFTKVDYKPLDERIQLSDDCVSFTLLGEPVSIFDPKYFENISYTLSYDVAKKSWVSFHSYTPYLYAWNRYNMYSFNSKGIWRHNVEGSFQNFYGARHPFSVEYVVNDLQTRDSFVYTSSILDTESFKWKDVGYVPSVVTFDKSVGFNSHQSSGLQQVINSENMSITDRSVQDPSKLEFLFKDRFWTFNDIVDRQISSEDFQFDKDGFIKPSPVNTGNISSYSKNNIFHDNYFSNRLIFDTFEDTKLLLKRVETNISIDSR